ncbi:MAG: beta-eliminating lyase-related protein [Paracoccaceae bacterium]
MFFASDNCSGAAPEILTAIAEANRGYCPSYGEDQLTGQVRDAIRTIFEAPEAEVCLVATGTAANALSLSLFCPPWGRIYCATDAHIDIDECGAVELAIGGGKMALVAADNGKMTPQSLQDRMRKTPEGSVHGHQHGVVTLANLTEAGTLYHPEEVRKLSDMARAQGMGLHMDGARFVNALVAAGCSPAELSWKAGVDVLSLGGTKNGCLAVEAVVLFDPEKAWEMELRRKRAGQLFSKHRLLSSQMLAYLKDGLWLRLAAHANQMGQTLSAALADLPGARLRYPTDGNMVFIDLPRATLRRAAAAGAAFSTPAPDARLDGADDERLTARFVASWATTTEEIERMVSLLKEG